MDKNPKFSSINANKFYESLINEEKGDVDSLNLPPIIEPGARTLKELKHKLHPNDISRNYMHPENISVAVQGKLPELSEKLGISSEEACFDKRIVDEIMISEQNLIEKTQLLYAIGLINIQPESFLSEPEISQNIIEKVVQQLEVIANEGIEKPAIGDGMSTDEYNVRQTRILAMSWARVALDILAKQDLITRTKIKLERNSDVIMTLQLPENAKDSPTALEKLNKIITGGYSLQDFYEWQANLPQLILSGEKGGVGSDGKGNTDVIRGQRRDILHEGRLEFISKLGDALTNKNLPWYNLVSDVKVFSTNFSTESAYGINYIALSCQFEYKPGQQIEITVLERPSRQGVIDLDTGNVTGGKEENATYIYVSRAPKAWMEVFNKSRPYGARRYDDLGRTTNVPGEPTPLPVGGASYLTHVDFSEFNNLQNKEEILQKHLDKLVKVILAQVIEIQNNSRA